ncbi:MAG: nucleoside monophosphate kinase [Patescibacteria group bacterium]
MQAQTLVFFGIVGSGKGTQVKLATEFLKSKGVREVVCVGTGDIFRKIVDSSANDDYTKMIKDLLLAGKLVPDEETNKLVLDIVESQMSPDKDFIFDGYPRTVIQSGVFENMMEKSGRKDIKIIYIELSKEEAMKRNLLRGRSDDTEAGLNMRFDEYVNNVVPAMNYFKDKTSYGIYKINGEQSIEDVHKDIINALGF